MSEEIQITCRAPLDMLRACSPVYVVPGVHFVDPATGAESVSVRSPGIVRGFVGALVEVMGSQGSALGDDTVTVCADALEMDLTSETGRAHVDRWIAREVTGHDAAAYFYTTPDGAVGERHLFARVCYVADCWPVGGGMGSDVFEVRDVPALADLDPDDQSLLPDGSSVLAALVRKAIVEHLIAQRSAK